MPWALGHILREDRTFHYGERNVPRALWMDPEEREEALVGERCAKVTRDKP